ncbi:MAG: TRAP transporter substrate-binding protein [Rhodospirillales bacterium]
MMTALRTAHSHISKAALARGATVAAAALLFLGAQAASAQTVVKFAHSEGEGDLLQNPYWAYTEVFSQGVAAGTDGRYEIQVFPNKQLGDLESMMEQTSRGIVQMVGGISAGHLSSYDPNVQVLEMPYTFPSTQVGREVMNGTFGDDLADSVAEKSNLRILSYLPSAFRNFSNNQKPIRTAADMEGMKIRVQNIPIHVEMVESLGASATPIAWAELYNALQTGVVDGQENAPYTMLLANLHEVQKYYTLDNHLLNMPLIAMNEDFYQSLSPEDRAVFQQAADDAAFAMLGIIKAKESQDLATIRKADTEIYQPSPEEMATFVEATRGPIVEIMQEKVDPVWIDKLFTAIDQAQQ